MARSRTTWQKGQSGNPKGRPRAECELVSILIKQLNGKRRNVSHKTRLVNHLIQLATAGDTADIKRIFDIVQRSYEFDRRTEIFERLDAIEKRLEEMENE